MILQLTRAFNTLNEGLFDGCLVESVKFKINLSRRCIFHFIAPKTIEIGSLLLEAKKEDVIDDLGHVMVHMCNFQRGIVDHTSNQYHNRHFVERALALGLIVVHHKARGWAITVSDPSQISEAEARFPEKDASDHLARWFQKISWSELEFENFKSALAKDIQAKPQKEYLLKYVCGSCSPPVIVRSGRRPDGLKPLDITCNHCGTNFVLENERLS